MKKYPMLTIFFLFTFAIVNAQQTKSIYGILQGKWQCFQDGKYFIEFKRDTLIEQYGKSKDKFYFHYIISQKNCGIPFKELIDSNSYFLTKIEYKNSDRYCYLIKNIAETSIELVFEGGKIYSFSKIKKK